LGKLRASIINRLRVVTGVNPDIHVMDFVMQLDASQSGKIISVTSRNQS
jgi:DNA-directed RNA polymerase subunit H (RpoH/RPB5)